MVINNPTSFYKNKKVFLTGHTGFKGSWLLKWLYSMGAQVKGYSLAPQHKNDLYHVINGDSICQSVIDDITNYENLKSEMVSFKPDIIFHLAAQPLVRYSYQQPVETFMVNTMGTAYVLDILRGMETKCAAVIVTTDKVYENLEKEIGYQESDRLGGYDPYSSSKAASELVINSYRNSFFNLHSYSKHQKSIASARSGNVIGGGDWNTDRIIPDVVSALTSNKKVILRNPASVRPWQHVLDPLYGYLLLGKSLYESPAEFSEAWNFGPDENDCCNVETLVKNAIGRWGSGEYVVPSQINQPHEAGFLMLNTSKAKSKLQWNPSYNVNEAIALTIDWYKQPDAEKNKFTAQQLKNYLS